MDPRGRTGASKPALQVAAKQLRVETPKPAHLQLLDVKLQKAENPKLKADANRLRRFLISHFELGTGMLQSEILRPLMSFLSTESHYSSRRATMTSASTSTLLWHGKGQEDGTGHGAQGGKFCRKLLSLVHCSNEKNGGLVYVSSGGNGKEVKRKSILTSVFEGMVAGAAAGVTVETALYPIDTIKTRLQVARSGGGINIKGLYSGLSGNLTGVLPASAIFVGVYEPLKQQLLRMLPSDLSVAAHLTAGAAGGTAASLVRVPTEVVKQRMQMGQFPSAPVAVRSILKAEGLPGLYAGYGSFLLRDIPFDAIQFAVYEQLVLLAKKTVRRDLRDTETAIIGAMAGAVTGAVTTPLDVIKTRLMVQGAKGRYKGILDCAMTTVKEEGSFALFKGIGPRVMWIGIGGSIFFAVLEKTKQLMAKANSPAEPSTVLTA